MKSVKYIVFDSDQLFFWRPDGKTFTSKVEHSGQWTLEELAASGFDLNRKTLLTVNSARMLERKSDP